MIPRRAAARRDHFEVALVHDYLTQRGGAERVLLSMSKAFPSAPIYTSLYDPDGTFPEFASLDVRTAPLNRIRGIRRTHRRALPLLALTFSAMRIDPGVDVVLCSSSGWAHGVRPPEGARKVVYCHNPARWLYQTSEYVGPGAGAATRVAAAATRQPLLRWDQAAAASADRYLVNSTVVGERVARRYGIASTILFPPCALSPGDECPAAGIEPGYFLAVGRLLNYKNVGVVQAAFGQLPHHRLVVVGDGPLRGQLEATAPPNVRHLGTVHDSELRWLYAHSQGLISASYEDFGLTPLEAASFGKPTLALRWGGFLDTVREGRTGTFFDSPTPEAVSEAVRRAASTSWSRDELLLHAEKFSEERFISELQDILAPERLQVEVGSGAA